MSGRWSPSGRLGQRLRRRSPASRDVPAADDGVAAYESNLALTDDDVSIIALSASQGGGHEGDDGEESLLDSCFLRPTPESLLGAQRRSGQVAAGDDQSYRSESSLPLARKQWTGSHPLLPSRARSPGSYAQSKPTSRRYSPVPHSEKSAAPTLPSQSADLQRSQSASSLSSRLPRWTGSRRPEDVAAPIATNAERRQPENDPRSESLTSPFVPRQGTGIDAPRHTAKHFAQKQESPSSRRQPLRALSPAGRSNLPLQILSSTSAAAPDLESDDDSLRASDVASLVLDFQDGELAGGLSLEQWQRQVMGSRSGLLERGRAASGKGTLAVPGSALYSGDLKLDSQEEVDDDDTLPQSLLELLAATSPAFSAAGNAGDNDSPLPMSRPSSALMTRSASPLSPDRNQRREPRIPRSSGRIPVLTSLARSRSVTPTHSQGSRPGTPSLHGHQSRPVTPLLSRSRPLTPSRIPSPSKRSAGSIRADGEGLESRSEAVATSLVLSGVGGKGKKPVAEPHTSIGGGPADRPADGPVSGAAGAAANQNQANPYLQKRLSEGIGAPDHVPGVHVPGHAKSTEMAAIPWQQQRVHEGMGSNSRGAHQMPSQPLHTTNSDTDMQVSWPSSLNITAESATAAPRNAHSDLSSSRLPMKSAVKKAAMQTALAKAEGKTKASQDASSVAAQSAPGALQRQKMARSIHPTGEKAIASSSQPAVGQLSPIGQPRTRKFSTEYSAPVVIERDESKCRATSTEIASGIGKGAPGAAEDSEVLSQLQVNYEDLLTKYALAEVTIDQLRLGAKVHVETVTSATGDKRALAIGSSPQALTGLAASNRQASTNAEETSKALMTNTIRERYDDMRLNSNNLEKQLEVLRQSVSSNDSSLESKELHLEYVKLKQVYQALQSDYASISKSEGTSQNGDIEGDSSHVVLSGRLLELEAKLGLVRSLLLRQEDKSASQTMATGRAGNGTIASRDVQQDRLSRAEGISTQAKEPVLVPTSSPTRSDPVTVPLEHERLADDAGTRHSTTKSAADLRRKAATSYTSSDDEMLERKQQQLQMLRRYKSLKKMPRTPERAKEIHVLAEQLQGALRSSDSSEVSQLSAAGARGPTREANPGLAKKAELSNYSSRGDSGLSTPRTLPHYVSAVRLRLSRMQDSDSGFVPSETGPLSPESSRIIPSSGKGVLRKNQHDKASSAERGREQSELSIIQSLRDEPSESSQRPFGNSTVTAPEPSGTTQSVHQGSHDDGSRAPHSTAMSNSNNSSDMRNMTEGNPDRSANATHATVDEREQRLWDVLAQPDASGDRQKSWSNLLRGDGTPNAAINHKEDNSHSRQTIAHAVPDLSATSSGSDSSRRKNASFKALMHEMAQLRDEIRDGVAMAASGNLSLREQALDLPSAAPRAGYMSMGPANVHTVSEHQAPAGINDRDRLSALRGLSAGGMDERARASAHQSVYHKLQDLKQSNVRSCEQQNFSKEQRAPHEPLAGNHALQPAEVMAQSWAVDRSHRSHDTRLNSSREQSRDADGAGDKRYTVSGALAGQRCNGVPEDIPVQYPAHVHVPYAENDSGRLTRMPSSWHHTTFSASPVNINSATKTLLQPCSERKDRERHSFLTSSRVDHGEGYCSDLQPTPDTERLDIHQPQPKVNSFAKDRSRRSTGDNGREQAKFSTSTNGSSDSTGAMPSKPRHYPAQHLSYPAQQLSYPAQQLSYPAQHLSYPAQLLSYPAQQMSYSLEVGQTDHYELDRARALKPRKAVKHRKGRHSESAAAPFTSVCSACKGSGAVSSAAEPQQRAQQLTSQQQVAVSSTSHPTLAGEAQRIIPYPYVVIYNPGDSSLKGSATHLTHNPSEKETIMCSKCGAGMATENTSSADVSSVRPPSHVTGSHTTTAPSQNVLLVNSLPHLPLSVSPLADRLRILPVPASSLFNASALQPLPVTSLAGSVTAVPLPSGASALPGLSYLSTPVMTAQDQGYCLALLPVTVCSTKLVVPNENLRNGDLTRTQPEGLRKDPPRSHKRSSMKSHHRRATYAYTGDELVEALASATGTARKLRNISSKMRTFIEKEVEGSVMRIAHGLTL